VRNTLLELTNAHAALHAQSERLRDSDRRKDEFLATLAHELRNPLAPIRNALQIIQIAGNNGPAVEQARAMMERQLGQMVRLIDDLLDVSRISRGKFELRKERIELAAAIKSAVDTAQPLIDAAGHQLTVTGSPRPVYLDADPVRLAQVFSNLLNNAAKYMERGGRIWLTVTPEDREVVVSVRDTGIGIPAEARERSSSRICPSSTWRRGGSPRTRRKNGGPARRRAGSSWRTTIGTRRRA
jgi:signal transduction histidine kinase